MSRRDLHAFLLSEVPKERMTLGTKVLSIQQNQHGVMIRTNDGKHHHADILIGSDGAYSAVRQSLYKHMSAQGILPKSDGEPLKVCHMGILGTTERLDPEKFPRAHETFGHSGVVIGDKTRHTVSLCTWQERMEGSICQKRERKGNEGDGSKGGTL
jgi:2-polyprenyl-6-methoxyphenol hydroxylase-like FAD-dependent oxidoreductase